MSATPPIWVTLASVAGCHPLAGRAGRRAAWIAALAAVALVAVALAPRAGAFVYWANYDTGTIGRADLDGSDVNQSFITGAIGPVGLAVGDAGAYWANFDSSAIGRADLDGSDANQSLVTTARRHQGRGGRSRPRLLDESVRRLDRPRRPRRANANPSFITGLNGPADVAVDGDHVYWTNLNTGTIGRADLDGANVEQSLITGLGEPVGLTVDDAYLYWTQTAANAIGRADLDGANVNHSFVTGANSPVQIAADTVHLYWTNFEANTIARADLDGPTSTRASSPAPAAPRGWRSTPCWGRPPPSGSSASGASASAPASG